jgi:tetratricopeptide (TPR) repeat protein
MPVDHAVFDHDSQHVVTACRDGAARIWSVNGWLVALKQQAGEVRRVGYFGDGHGSNVGILSVKSPTLSGGIEPNRPVPDFVARDGPKASALSGGIEPNRPGTAASRYQIRVGVWDVSPLSTGVDPSDESFAKLGQAIAARRLGPSSREEQDLETIRPAQLYEAWANNQSARSLLSPTPALEEWHDRMAVDFEARGRWEAAIWHLSRLLEAKHDLARNCARRAWSYVELGQTAPQLREGSLFLAIKDLDQVLAIEPKNGRAFLKRAQIQLEQRKWEEAVKDFSKAEQLIGGDKQIWSGRGEARVGMQQWKAAIGDFREALKLDPDDGSAHEQLGNAYENDKRWQEAAHEFQEAARRLPNRLILRERHAACLHALGKDPQATQEYRDVARQYKQHRDLVLARAVYIKALALKPEGDAGPLHAELAETCSSLGLRDDAIIQYKRALDINREEWTYWRGLASVYSAMGAWPEAKEAYSKAIARKPDDAVLRRTRAWVFRQLKEWEHAALDYEAEVKLEPNFPQVRLWLADTYLEAGKFDEVRRCLEQAAQLDPLNEQPLLRLAKVHLLRRDNPNYRATCARMLDQFEQVKNPRTANNVAWACALAPDAVKEMDRAVRLARRAVELQPGKPNNLDTLGAVLYRAGDMGGTIEQLSRSRPIGATALYDRLFLAMAHHRSGHLEEARDLFEGVVHQLDASERVKTGSPRGLVLDPWQKGELSLLRAEAEKLIKPKQ